MAAASRGKEKVCIYIYIYIPAASKGKEKSSRAARKYLGSKVSSK